MRVIHYRGAAICAGCEIVSDTEGMPHFMRGELSYPRQRELAELLFGFVDRIVFTVRRNKTFGNKVVLPHPQRT